MLVLSRKKDEVIKIGDTITVTLLDIRGGSVRLGIEAPRSVDIVRAELVTGDRTPERTEARGIVTRIVNMLGERLQQLSASNPDHRMAVSVLATALADIRKMRHAERAAA